MYGDKTERARKSYYSHVLGCSKEKIEEEIEFKDEKTEYKSQRKILIRDFKADDIIEFVSSRMNIPKVNLYMKCSRNLVVAKALIVVLMRSLCNFKSSDICSILGNITQARVSKLSTIGMELVESEGNYANIIEDFIKCFPC